MTLVLNINENNARKYTTPESTTSAQNASQLLKLLGFQLGLLVQTKTHMIHNHNEIYLHIVIYPLPFHLAQRKQYKVELKIQLLFVILLVMFYDLQELFLRLHEI